MVHPRAKLTEFGRQLVVQRVLVLGWSPAHAAAATGVSRATVYERVLTDRGNGYRSRAFAASAETLHTSHKFTRPYRPQTSGKAERFIKTLLEEWAYARLYATNQSRLQALPRWLRFYNLRRPHTALKGLPPAVALVNNVGGNHT